MYAYIDLFTTILIQAEGERRKGGASKATPGEARARLLSDAMRVKGTENGLIGWTMVDAAGGEGDSVQVNELKTVSQIYTPEPIYIHRFFVWADLTFAIVYC